jgi:membrane protein
VMGLGILLLGATTVFGQLQDSLNSIWGVMAKPSRKGWIVMLVQRLISFAMVLTVGFVLLVSLVLTTTLTALVKSADRFVTVAPVIMRGADIVMGLMIITVLFALIFKILPDVEIRWRDVWRGAFITALLFSVGRYLIALYLGHSTLASTYGAAGSLVALLIWVYYSCAILFYGAEFTRAYHEAHDQPIVPKSTAVLVRKEIVEEERGSLAESPS